MFDNVLDKYEAQSVTKKESYSIPVGSFSRIKEKTANAKEADKNVPIVTMKDVYHRIAELSNTYPENSAIKSIAFHLKCKYESDPQGYFTLGQVEDLKKYAAKILPKKLFAKSSNIVCDVIDGIIKSSIKNRFDIKKLDKIASEITTQDQFDVAIETNGLSLDRPDMQEIREYIAYKINTKLSDETITTDAFKSEAKIARTASILNGGQYSEDILKKALSEDWKTIESEKQEHKAQFEGVMSDYSDKKGRMSIEAALAQSDVVKQFNPKNGNTYLVRKDVFGSFNLHSSKGSQDAILLDKYTSIEALKEDVSSLPDMWSL